jgi:Fe-S-cluster containining protein
VPGVSLQELFEAFHAAYGRMGSGVEKLYEVAAQAFAVSELLITKGVIGIEELNRVSRAVEERLRDAYDNAGMTVQLAESVDKYALETDVAIDCASRLHLCRAACCTLRFALSEQDIHEGSVQWELTQPYLNRQRADGYCVHCDGATKSCGVYASRPAVCRGYDCRQDTRIWVDFEGRVPNPELAALEDATRRPTEVE